MELNIYWNVFIEGTDNENMIPYNQDKLIHVYTGENHYFCKFNGSRFVENESGVELYFDEPVFWSYVPMLPNTVKKNVVERCTKEDGCCEYEDDGYCWDKPKNMKCEHCKVCSEYYAYNQ